MPLRLRSLLCAGAGLGLLATCAEPVNDDYTRRHPLRAQPETVALPLDFAGARQPFTGDTAEQFETLVAGYVDHGRGPLTVAAAGSGISEARIRRHVQAVTERLRKEGIPASAIHVVLAGAGGADTVTLSYERYSVELPSCGDWSTSMTFNPLNRDYPELGCALQRDIGLMVADPGDLVSMRRPQPSDPGNIERVLRDYRGIAPQPPPIAPETIKNALELSADQNAASGSTVGQNTGSSAGTSASTR